MAKEIIKKVSKWAGVDIRRHDKQMQTYAELYQKYKGFTMIPDGAFIDNLDLCDEYKNVAGDYVECGVWRGGMSAAVSELLGKERMVHLFDSFEGLPPAKEIDGQEALDWQKNVTSPGYYDNCTADESFTMDAMKLARHQKYKLYKGWFQNTLPGIQTSSIGILRLDGDWYDSIMVCLEVLFPKVVTGGIIVLDDYYTWDGCAKAVHDYLSKSASASRIYQWNNQVAYLIKKG
jgi:O-methyltransferase